MKWILWALLLVAQQFSHGVGSRAKNSNSYLYNLWAATLSNGVWICSNFILVDNAVRIMKDGDVIKAAFIAVFYTTFCVIGSLLSQWAAINYFEVKNERWLQ